MSDVTSRIPKYEALFQKVAADYSPMPLMVDDRFIRAVAMAFAELDARVVELQEQCNEGVMTDRKVLPNSDAGCRLAADDNGSELAHINELLSDHNLEKGDVRPCSHEWIMLTIVSECERARGEGYLRGVKAGGDAASELCGGALIAAELLEERGLSEAAEVLRSQIQACLEALGETGVVLGRKGG